MPLANGPSVRPLAGFYGLDTQGRPGVSRPVDHVGWSFRLGGSEHPRGWWNGWCNGDVPLCRTHSIPSRQPRPPRLGVWSLCRTFSHAEDSFLVPWDSLPRMGSVPQPISTGWKHWWGPSPKALFAPQQENFAFALPLVVSCSLRSHSPPRSPS
jgi:hypothetical protein